MDWGATVLARAAVLHAAAWTRSATVVNLVGLVAEWHCGRTHRGNPVCASRLCRADGFFCNLRAVGGNYGRHCTVCRVGARRACRCFSSSLENFEAGTAKSAVGLARGRFISGLVLVSDPLPCCGGLRRTHWFCGQLGSPRALCRKNKLT